MLLVASSLMELRQFRNVVNHVVTLIEGEFPGFFPSQFGWNYMIIVIISSIIKLQLFVKYNVVP